MSENFSPEARKLLKAAYRNYNHLTMLDPEGRTIRYVAGTEVLAPEEEEKAQKLNQAMEKELIAKNFMSKKTDTIDLTEKGKKLAEDLLK